MTHRERWLGTFHFEPVDHVPDEEFGYWGETLQRWHADGLPEWVDDNGKADRWFGFAPRHGVPVHHGLMPGFEHKVIEEDDRHVTLRGEDGVVCMVNKDGSSSIPKYIRFPVETRADWEDFKKRLDPNDPQRYWDDEFWANVRNKAKGCDCPVGVGCGSLFGWVRNWMGFENCAIAAMEDPEWIEEMIEHITQLILATIDRPSREVRLDYASFWEDMCFRSGPLISPKLFQKWMTPRYKRITDLLKSRGVDIFIVDCDGNIQQLVEHWLEGGVNVMFPLEIRGGTDPHALREKYGRQVLLLGGVDKIQLMGDKEMVRKEIKRITPLVEQGGYIPHVDHRVPPDVSYENYLYYLDCKRDTFGIPKPAPYEERYPEA